MYTLTVSYLLDPSIASTHPATLGTGFGSTFIGASPIVYTIGEKIKYVWEILGNTRCIPAPHGMMHNDKPIPITWVPILFAYRPSFELGSSLSDSTCRALGPRPTSPINFVAPVLYRTIPWRYARARRPTEIARARDRLLSYRRSAARRNWRY
jgi:hypothetical protein